MDGLVSKNGTLLLDYTLTLMERGKTAEQAIIEAGKKIEAYFYDNNHDDYGDAANGSGYYAWGWNQS